jgi:thioredoxin-related protein
MIESYNAIMRSALTLLLLVTAILAPTAILAQGEVAAKKPVREQFDPKREPEKDIAAAVVLAKKQNKRIILDIGGEWCPWCHKLDNFFLEQKDVAEFLHKNYVVVKVNYSQENKNEMTISKYGVVKGYPHLFVLDKDGKLLHSQDTGLLETGDHHDHDKVFEFLKKWAK